MAPAQSTTTLPTEDVQESLYELLEYVDLLQLGSPRVQSTDQVDPFISRYSVPETSSDGEVETQNVRVLKWEGLISVQWMLTLLYGLMYAP
jgi:ribonuclease P/MRP protein subunit RPP40